MIIKIGVSGNEGSFSEEAANYICQKNAIKDYTLEYLISVESVLSALKDGVIDRGVFPIENSNGGIVYEAVYAMAKHTFTIEQIFEIDVRHNLMVVPGTKSADIKTIASHQQALKQCRMYLRRTWEAAELKEWSDTAQAAKDLAGGVLSPDTAIIAPKRAAELYGLEIMEENIQDLKFNFTTFILAIKKIV